MSWGQQQETLPCKIYNVKLHFCLPQTISSDRLRAFGVKCRNFWVVRLNPYVFTVFVRATECHVNVTGIATTDLIEKAVKAFARLFNVGEDCMSQVRVTVDNLTASGSLRLEKVVSRSHIDAYLLCDFLKVSESTTVGSLRPNFFPAIVLRRPDCCTVILFRNSRYVILGAKDVDQVREARNRLIDIVRQSEKAGGGD